MGTLGSVDCTWATGLRANKAGAATVQTRPAKGGAPGSAESTLDWVLRIDCEPSSQTFRQGALEVSESAPWLAMPSVCCPAEIAATSFSAKRCAVGDSWLWGMGASSTHALTTPEVMENKHTSSTTNAVLRLARGLGKGVMAGKNTINSSYAVPAWRP